MWLLILSTIIEIGMFILSVFVPVMASKSNNCIHDFDIKLTVFILAGIMFVRVLQTILIILFMLCCVPCYCFNDDCFIKRRLISKKRTSEPVLKLLPHWSWVYRNTAEAAKPIEV